MNPNPFFVKASLLCGVVLLSACNGSDSTQAPVEPPQPNAKEPLYLSDFATNTAGEFPAGWLCTSPDEQGQCPSVYVQDGALFVDGTAKDYTATSIALADVAADAQSFKVDIDFTITEANSSSRWVGFKYLIQDDEPFYQMVVRQDATAGNGTEFVHRLNSGTVIEKTSFTEQIDAQQSYHASIVVSQGRVQHYLNDQLVANNVLTENMQTGLLGVQAAGSILKLSRIEVTQFDESLAPLPTIYQPQQASTPVIKAPQLIQSISSMSDLQYQGSALMYLDAALAVSDESGVELGAIEQVFANGQASAIPVLYVANNATVDALAAWVKSNNVIDITLVAQDLEVLSYAKNHMPHVRAVADFSAAQFAQSDDLPTMVGNANRAGAKVVVLPPHLVSQSNVKYLQRMLLNVWVKAGQHDVYHAAQLLAAGIDALISSDSEQYNEVLKAYADNTILKTPMITGHRGNPSQLAENTVEGALLANEMGADAVEYDIQLTTDGHLVIMHDTTVNRTTDGKGKIEEMTLEQVKQLTVIDDNVSGLKVPTLDEMLTALKDKEVTHFIELKSKNPDLVAKLAQKLEQYQVYDQVIAISSQDKQLQKMAELLPQVPLGYLTGLASTDIVPMEQTLRNIITTTQALNSTYNPPNDNLSKEVIDAAYARGIIMMPRTLKNQAQADTYFLYGAHGLPSNYAQWFSNYGIALNVQTQQQSVAVNERLALPVEQLQQNKQVLAAEGVFYRVLESSAEYQFDDQGELYFTSPGQAVVIAQKRFDVTENRFYHLTSQPVTLSIN